MKKAILLLSVILALILIVGCTPKKNYDDFAKCMTKNNVTMYGAYWCPHCNAVKKEFGNSFRFINYVECDQNGPNGDPDTCQKKGIQYYPTFIFGDESVLFGDVGFDIMSEKTGCTLP